MMAIFSPVIEAFWQAQFLSGSALFEGENLCIHVRPDLQHKRRLTLLESTAGKLLVMLDPALAEQLGLAQMQDLTPKRVRSMLDEAGIALHGADHVFHFTETARAALMAEPEASHIRRLHAADDAAVFSEFQANASAQDKDDAWVELDHWAVFGAFDAGGTLMCAASMYPWQNAQIADIGVLTLAPFRGQGQARRVVRALARHAYHQGYQPQYRCQLDNAASIALARAAGLHLYGNWDVIAQ